MTEHLPIQRWKKIFTRYPASELLPNESGEYVTYADHLAALRSCEERVHEIAYAQGLGAGSDEHRQHEIGWMKGYAAALDAARDAVDACQIP